MKKIFLATTMALAFSGVASASSDGSNGVSDRLTGNDAATYYDPYFGDNVTCNETQHRKFDTVSCTLTDARPDLAGTTGTIGWYSDFDGEYGSLTFTFSEDGATYSGKATY